MNANPAALVREVFQPTQDGSNPPVVEKVKDTLGMGSESQSGSEPVSGETGEGTVGRPFDQGNQEGLSGTASNEVEGKVGSENASGS